MIFRLHSIDVEEISFVDKGAGKGVKVKLFKNRKVENMNFKERLQAAIAKGNIKVVQTLGYVAKRHFPEEIEKLGTINVSEKLDEILGKLSEEERTIVEMALAAAAGQLPDMEATPADNTEEVTMQGGEDSEEEEERTNKSKKLPDEVLKKLEKAEKLEKRVAEMEELEKHRDYISKAKKFGHLPVATEDLAKFLRIMDGTHSTLITKGLDVSEPFVTFLGRVDELLKKSQVFDEIGHGRQMDTGSAVQQLESIAKKLKADDPKMSEAQAFTKACELNPSLYTKHVEEQTRRS